MMRAGRVARLAWLACACAQPAFAEGWQVLDDAGITAALSEQALSYDATTSQRFFADGRTVHEADGTPSWGKWWVADARYCSSWPPSDRPSCYTVEALGQEVRFIASGGEVTVGRYANP